MCVSVCVCVFVCSDVWYVRNESRNEMNVEVESAMGAGLRERVRTTPGSDWLSSSSG